MERMFKNFCVGIIVGFYAFVGSFLWYNKATINLTIANEMATTATPIMLLCGAGFVVVCPHKKKS
jgi:hypothetical protein